MINNIKGLTVVDYIGDRKGIFQAITKVPAGFMIATEIGSEVPSLNRWKKGALQSIQFKAEGANHWMTVFAKKGTKIILLDEKIAETITVGTINSLFYNTNLIDQAQYRSVNAKTWADKAFLLNE
jgi:hypothetical protein